jgi:hypothetical protein
VAASKKGGGGGGGGRRGKSSGPLLPLEMGGDAGGISCTSIPLQQLQHDDLLAQLHAAKKEAAAMRNRASKVASYLVYNT